jgi:hypothetical protein
MDQSECDEMQRTRVRIAARQDLIHADSRTSLQAQRAITERLTTAIEPLDVTRARLETLLARMRPQRENGWEASRARWHAGAHERPRAPTTHERAAHHHGLAAMGTTSKHGDVHPRPSLRSLPRCTRDTPVPWGGEMGICEAGASRKKTRNFWREPCHGSYHSASHELPSHVGCSSLSTADEPSGDQCVKRSLVCDHAGCWGVGADGKGQTTVLIVRAGARLSRFVRRGSG